jgi:hypothetical protein
LGERFSDGFADASAGARNQGSAMGKREHIFSNSRVM